MILDLRELELDLVPVDGLDGEVGGVGDHVVIGCDPVHQDVKAGGHLRADHHAEGGGELLRLAAVLPPAVQDQVLGDYDPVIMVQREVGLDSEHHVLANLKVYDTL